MTSNNFINSLRTLNEENIIYHIKNIKHTPIEIHILKKRLIEIRNYKKTKMREFMMKQQIIRQNELIRKQQLELLNQKIKFQNEILKEQNKQLNTRQLNTRKLPLIEQNYPVLTKLKQEIELQHPSITKIDNNINESQKYQNIKEIYDNQQINNNNDDDNIEYIKELIKRKNNKLDLMNKLDRINFLFNKVNNTKKI